MTFVIAALMIAGVAAVIAYPFWTHAGREPAADSNDSRELLKREKEVALLAIREAELDQAMGKLSQEDYGVLRSQYESRAVGAIAALDALDGSRREAPSASAARRDGAGSARFCSACGRRFQTDERFCPACGHARSTLT